MLNVTAEDKTAGVKNKKKVEAKNALENYAYKDEKIAGKLDPAD
jgi:hypothetical protein